MICFWHSFSMAFELQKGIEQTTYRRANATFYTLCRNSDLYELLETIQNYNNRFNDKFKYDWIFLNDKPFTEEFKRAVQAITTGNAYFDQIPEEYWSLPENLNVTKMYAGMKLLRDDPDGAAPYATSLSYRHMCRFESGFFYKQKLLQKYRFFWRVEPGVRLKCDINHDLFKEMEDNNYDYGFTIGMVEYSKTIPSLFKSMRSALQSLGKDHLLTDTDNYSEFVFDRNTNDYNYCHFWTNFEIGNLDVFRSKEYNEIFEALDRYNGFYYERWGDAPVRSLILSLLLKKGTIKRFSNIGYTHPPYTQCPTNEKVHLSHRCTCDPSLDITNEWYSCSWIFDNIESGENPLGISTHA